MSEDTRHKLAPIPVGTTITITTGDWSAYQVLGVWRALVTLDCAALRAEWTKLHSEKAEPWSFEESAFISWLETAGFIEPIPNLEWFLADGIDEMRVRTGVDE